MLAGLSVAVGPGSIARTVLSVASSLTIVLQLPQVIPTPSHFRPYLAQFSPVFSQFLRVVTISPRRFQRAPSRNPGPRNGGTRTKENSALRSTQMSNQRSAVSNAWQPLPDMLLPRRGHTMCRVGADLIVLGGARGRGAKAKTVSQLELFDGAKWCAPPHPPETASLVV